MSAKLACIAGATIYRMLKGGHLDAQEPVRKLTPFGLPEPAFLVNNSDAPFYLMPRHGPGLDRPAPWPMNVRANLYALKDLGVEAIVSWSAAGAITHNLHLGQLMLPDDVLDMTRRRPMTMFENCALGFLRQFPVFCDPLREMLADVMVELGLSAQMGGTVAVTEGPRLETPAEVRMLATVGAEVVTHTLAPEVFLARELQMCYAGICYIVNYAETGSRHRPFNVGELFAELRQDQGGKPPTDTAELLPKLLTRLAAKLKQTPPACDCRQSMSEYIKDYDLSDNWREWFD